MSVASSTISSVIKAEVIPGGQSYASDLTITNTGGIVVSTTATSTPIPALYIPTGVTGATITNFGTITSSTPQINEGGIGIEASSPFVLDNHSVIQGSYIGAFLREGGSFANTGTIGGALGGVLNNVNVCHQYRPDKRKPIWRRFERFNTRQCRRNSGRNCRRLCQ